MAGEEQSNKEIKDEVRNFFKLKDEKRKKKKIKREKALDSLRIACAKKGDIAATIENAKIGAPETTVKLLKIVDLEKNIDGYTLGGKKLTVAEIKELTEAIK
ncbi:hypothetical protein KAR26_03730 [Candidatus Parcubacteria bacterium]|nr:hypothetical protein [Candidatus Parcubacteria bacterium]MCK5592041.1 hypothetical protein [Candidatus Paceibacterota bacterium]